MECQLFGNLWHLIKVNGDGEEAAMMDEEESSLKQHRIASLPASFYYIPDFISPAEEDSLLAKARFPSHSLPSYFYELHPVAGLDVRLRS